jgi:hypothetical protein
MSSGREWSEGKGAAQRGCRCRHVAQEHSLLLGIGVLLSCCPICCPKSVGIETTAVVGNCGNSYANLGRVPVVQTLNNLLAAPGSGRRRRTCAHTVSTQSPLVVEGEAMYSRNAQVGNGSSDESLSAAPTRFGTCFQTTGTRLDGPHLAQYPCRARRHGVCFVSA